MDAAMPHPELRHRCPGRLRLRWAGLRHPDLRVDWLQAWLPHRCGLDLVRVNAAGGTLVAEFAERNGVFEDICHTLEGLPPEAHSPAPVCAVPPARRPLDAALSVALAAGGALLPPGPQLGLGATAATPVILRGAAALAQDGLRGKTLEMAAALYALALGDGSAALRVAAMSTLGDALRQATEEKPGERLAELLVEPATSELAEEVKRELMARPAPERLSDRLGDRLALWILIFGGLVHAATGEARRALPVFAVDYSCAVKFSAPLAAWRGLREARKTGAHVRGASALERLAQADVFVLTSSALALAPELAQVPPLLRKQGARRIVALAGQAGAIASALQDQLALDEAHSGLSPQAMADAVRSLRDQSSLVAVVGCADTDALAMLAADVGIALQADAQNRLAAAAAGIRLAPGDASAALLAVRDAGAGTCAALKASFAAGVAAHSSLFAAREARLLSRRAEKLSGRAATASVLLGAWLGASPRGRQG